MSIVRFSHAQITGTRYIDDVFTSVDTAGTTNVIFGYNLSKNYFTGATKPVTLKLDFYQPAGDVVAQRPLIILAFGGSFAFGTRQDLDSLCRAFTRKGYVTAEAGRRPGQGMCQADVSLPKYAVQSLQQPGNNPAKQGQLGTIPYANVA